MSDDIDKHVSRRFEVQQKLGKGAYGIVWKALEKKTKEQVALKKVFDAFQNSTDAQRTYREVVYLLQMDHENIIKLNSVIKADNDKDLYLVFEYMETDLHATIRANILEEIHKQYIMYQAFKALAYMHSASLIHRDMKPANLLLNSECLMKVADFGLARSLNSMLSSEDRMDTMTDYVATRWYRAPEILVGSTQYGAKADLWSLGCIFGEMINAKPVFGGTSTLNQLEVISELLGHPSPEQVASLKSTFATTMYENVSGSGSESGSEGGIAALPEKERKARFVTKFPTVRPRRRPLTRTGTVRCRLAPSVPRRTARRTAWDDASRGDYSRLPLPRCPLPPLPPLPRSLRCLGHGSRHSSRLQDGPNCWRPRCHGWRRCERFVLPPHLVVHLASLCISRACASRELVL